jgi:hypothetical protein
MSSRQLININSFMINGTGASQILLITREFLNDFRYIS